LHPAAVFIRLLHGIMVEAEGLLQRVRRFAAESMKNNSYRAVRVN
jgi:hypothetical protein